MNVRYRVRAHANEVEGVARALALEQSVEVPLEAVRDAYVAEHIATPTREPVTPLLCR